MSTSKIQQARLALLLGLILLLAGCARPQAIPTPDATALAARATRVAAAPTVTPRPWETPPARVPTALPTPNLPMATPYATPRPQSDVYESVEMGLRLAHPFHWSRSSDAVPGAEVQLANQPDTVFLLIARAPLEVGRGLEELGPEAHAGLAALFGGLLELDESAGTAIGEGESVRAWLSDYVFRDGAGIAFRARMYSFANAGQLISLVAYGEERHMQAEAPTLAAILASVTLGPPPVFGLPRAETYVTLEEEPGDPREYDPAVGQGDRRVFSGLVRLEPDLRLAPELAASWAVDAGGAVYTFYLRPDARFHDGRPVTAADVVYSWERAADPATGSATALAALGDIKGAAERRRGEAPAIAGLHALDERTLEVTLVGPRPHFLLKLAAGAAAVVDRANVAEGAGWYRRPNGTGPYRLISWMEGKAKLYERVDGAHSPEDAPRYLAVRLAAPYGGLYAYAFGELDQTPLSGQARAILAGLDGLAEGEVREVATLCTAYVAFDASRPPFDDAHARQAFALAVDRERYAERALAGAALPAHGLYPPAMPGYDPQFNGARFDPQAARARLAESPYAGALPPITLTTSGYGLYVPPGVGVLVQMWQEQLGARIDIAQLEPGAFAEAVRGPERGNLFFWEACAPYPDPEVLADALFHSASAQNVGRYSSRDLDALLERARGEADVAARLSLYRQAEAMLVEDGAAIFLSHRLDAYLVAPRVRGAVAAPGAVPVERYLSIGE